MKIQSLDQLRTFAKKIQMATNDMPENFIVKLTDARDILEEVHVHYSSYNQTDTIASPNMVSYAGVKFELIP